jgi:hypothetical protein
LFSLKKEWSKSINYHNYVNNGVEFVQSHFLFKEIYALLRTYVPNIKIYAMKLFPFFFIFLVSALSFSVNGQTTRLANSMCGGSVASMGSNIACNVNLGQGHRFELSRLDGSVIGVYDARAANQQSPSRSAFLMRFTWFSQCAIGYNETYRVRVAWHNGTSWSAYGVYCNISTPSSNLRLRDDFCGATLDAMGTNVLVENNNMCGHRFEVRNTDNTLVGVYDALAGSVQNPTRSPFIFRFSYMPNGSIFLNTTYRIRVSFFDNQLNQWSPYGPTCLLSTPVQLVEIRSVHCGNIIPSLGSNVYTNGNFGSGFRFEVRTTNENLVGVYDGLAASQQFPSRSPYFFRFSFMPQGTILFNTVYRIRVAWFNPETNQWSPYGPACDIQTPGSELTQLTEQWCDNPAVPSAFTNILADPVAGVSQYYFTITASGYGAITTLVKNSNSFQLSELPNPHPIVDVQYNVEVRTRVSPESTLSNPGGVCFVTLAAPTTVIANANCGRSYNYLIQDSVYAVPISGAQMYRYRLVDQANNNVLLDTVANRTTYNGVSLSKFPGIQYGRTYRMSVGVRVNGVWGSYGDECTITTVAVPITVLRSNYCDLSVPSCGSNIYCNALLYASQYQFHVTGGGVNEVYQNPNGNSVFRLSWLSQSSQVNYGETFNVRCRAFVNGGWTPWDDVCTVTLAQPNSRLTTYCNATVPTWGTNVVTSSVGCAADYRFMFNGPGMDDVIFNPTNFTNQFRPNQLTSLGMLAGSTYSVRVSVLATGSWSPWGTACNLTTPAATILPFEGDDVEDNVEDEEGTASLESISIWNPAIELYPNPYNTDFKLVGLYIEDDKVEVSIIDALGKKVYEGIFSSLDLSNGIILGSDLPKGWYQVKLNAPNFNQSKSIVKVF